MTIWMMLGVLALAQDTPATGRPAAPVGFVRQAPGAPVVIEGSRSSAQRAHAEVTVRNTSLHVVTALTFGVSPGLGGDTDDAVRVVVRLAPGERVVVAVPPRETTDRTAGPPAGVRLAVTGAEFADAAPWGARPSALPAPDTPVTRTCLAVPGSPASQVCQAQEAR